MEDATMARSRGYTRRALLTLAAPVAALGLIGVSRAQTSESDCALGFIHGLLQFDPDCPLLDPPGTTIGELDYAVAPPHHLVALLAAMEGATGTGTGVTRVPQSGSRRKRKKARLRKRRRRGNGGGGRRTANPTPTPTPTPTP
jgi:hypothetical protein